jgi:AcrR family transcriptional regulator
MNSFFQNINVNVSQNLYLKDPLSSELGIHILDEGLVLMNSLGYENFTIKKLAKAIKTTESSVYRYFENKRKLTLYYLSWYCAMIEFLIVTHISENDSLDEIINQIIVILINQHELKHSHPDLSYTDLQQLISAELEHIVNSNDSAFLHLKNEVTDSLILRISQLLAPHCTTSIKIKELIIMLFNDLHRQKRCYKLLQEAATFKTNQELAAYYKDILTKLISV